MKKRIDDRLCSFFSNNTPLEKAIRYSLLAPGKRIRPLLVLGITEDLGGNLDHALDPACALEMIHAYSLIHDDLPCMDDDAMRRGKPTLHIETNEATALLAGDALLTKAFSVISDAPFLTADVKLQLIQTLSHAAGIDGMIGGQMNDLHFEDPTWEKLQKIHRDKTAALFGCAFAMSALIAGKHPNPYYADGIQFGLAFQLQDDLDDRTEDEPSLNASNYLSVSELENTIELIQKKIYTKYPSSALIRV